MNFDLTYVQCCIDTNQNQTKKSIIFWDMTPCSPSSFKLATHVLAFFAELISSTLKMEAIFSSETSVETRRTSRRHIPENDILHNHRCENLKSKIKLVRQCFM
jgi:hypothetical protein